jgi:hypothetical protein
MIMAGLDFGSVFAVAAQMPQTATSQAKGSPTVTTEQLRGTVAKVGDNILLVEMPTGELKEFTVPPTRKFVIDGKPLALKDLKPGTKLTATITTATTPVTTRTTTVGSGTVWHVSDNKVILTLPNGENKTYIVEDSYRFIVDGREASVKDLKPGMTVSGERIVEEPSTTITSDIVVTGEAPPAP